MIDVKTAVRREVGYLREDASSLRARVPRPDVSPQRKTAIILLAGVASAVHGFSLWSEATAWVVLGVLVIGAGFVLVDLDPPRRRRRTVRKKVS